MSWWEPCERRFPRAIGLLRRHWLIVSALCAGAALRVAVLLAYWPALLYIDSPRYLYGMSVFDPLGYLALRPPRWRSAVRARGPVR